MLSKVIVNVESIENHHETNTQHIFHVNDFEILFFNVNTEKLLSYVHFSMILQIFYSTECFSTIIQFFYLTAHFSIGIR